MREEALYQPRLAWATDWNHSNRKLSATPNAAKGGLVIFCAKSTTETKTDPRASSFWSSNRSNLAGIAVLNPFPWESERVLRPLRTEFPAQAVRVHSMQEGAHTVLVPVHESGNHFCGRAL